MMAQFACSLWPGARENKEEYGKARVGVIGAGGVATNRHLPALKEIPEVETSVIWSRDPGKAAAVATKFGIPTTVDSWQEITDSPELDAVVIATPPVLHLPATVRALDAGKHVLCQARMARNLGEAQQMLSAARKSDLVTALYPPRPGLKGNRVMIRLLHEEQFVGEVQEVRVVGMAWFGEGWESFIWDSDVVGVNMLTLGMWNEVVNRWLGPSIEVAALTANRQPKRQTEAGAWIEAGVPDSVVVAARLECGANASYHFSGHVACPPAQAIEIYGSGGTLVYNLFADEIRGASVSNPELTPVPIPIEEERFQDTDALFIRAIREGTPVLPDFEEGIQYMEFCEAVALSTKTGNAVSVPPQPRMDSWNHFS